MAVTQPGVYLPLALRAIAQALRKYVEHLGVFAVFFGLFVLSDAPILGGQTATNNSRPVSLYLSILDTAGNPVDSAVAKDLTVLEENKPQVITKLQFEKDAPVSLGVLIDVSRSMGAEGINLALSWLKTLAGTLKSPDELFVNAFSDESQEVVDFISPEDYLGEALDHLGTGGQSRTALAVDLALIKLRDARNRKKALLLLSAGRDIAGPATLDHISKFGFPVYALGVPGSSGATSTLDKLKNLNLKGSALKVYAEHSGGEAVFVQSAAETEQVISRVCLLMKNQYRLDYTSGSNGKPGKMLKVEVKAQNPQWDVRYLKKYPVSSR